MMKRKRIKVETYEGLVTAIRELIDQARAKGVPFFERSDLLACRHCGAYENVLALCEDLSARKRVFLNPKLEVDREFIVVDVRERQIKAPKGKTSYRTTYQFICGVCGAHQRLAFSETFDNL